MERSRFLLGVQSPKKADVLTEMFIKRGEDLAIQGVPYKLGGKSLKGIDCSGFFTLFGVKQGLVSKGYMINVGHARALFDRKSHKKKVEDLKRGDVIYFNPKEGTKTPHIAVITNFAYNWGDEIGLEILDASYSNGVSKREIVLEFSGTDREYTVQKDGVTYKYDIYGGTNPLLEFQKEAEKEKVKNNQKSLHIEEKSKDPKQFMYFSYYNVGDPRQNDDSPCIGASGMDICRVLEGGDKSIALVKPIREKYGIKRRDRVVLAGDDTCAGEYIVLDEMNKRFRQPDNQCVKNQQTNTCIRGDIAYPYGVRGSGGLCYILDIKKAN